MKSFVGLIFLVPVLASAASPVQKVLQMLSDLQAKVTAEGAAAEKAFEEFSTFCKDRSKELKFEIKTGKGEAADLSATIQKAAADIDAFSAKIEGLAGSISSNERDLKSATEIRNKEAKDFSSQDAELSDTIDTITRASAIIEREMQKGASFAQVGAQGLIAALQSLVQASAVASADAAKLTALVQNSAASDDTDSSLGAPDGAVYTSHSGNILDVLDNLRAEAQEQLDGARKTEMTAKHNFDMLKQSLSDSIKYDSEDLDAAKKGSADASQTKASAEGDLQVTSTDLAEDEKSLSGLEQDCTTKAREFEEAKKSRSEELGALAQAEKIIKEATGGAAGQTYGFGQVSFLQVAQGASPGMSAIRIVRRMAFAQRSASLSQLASRMESASRSSGPFDKIKQLIADMIEKLEGQQSADATQKAFCDKEIAENTASKEESTATINKLNTKIDQMESTSKRLKEEVATLTNELAELAKSWAAMDKLRAEEHATYSHDRPEMEQGVEGIKQALKVLRDYYAKKDGGHDSAEGAASGIVSLLEVAEADFSKGLAEMVSTEERAQADFEAQTQENKITKTTKDKDVQYKNKEAASLEKSAAEHKSDRDGEQEKLDAVMETLASLEKQCTYKVDSYAERAGRRQAEIAGLKSALETLSAEDASLVQRAQRTVRQLRGTKTLRAE